MLTSLILSLFCAGIARASHKHARFNINDYTIGAPLSSSLTTFFVLHTFLFGVNQGSLVPINIPFFLLLRNVNISILRKLKSQGSQHNCIA